jgi:hypothetical protein
MLRSSVEAATRALSGKEELLMVTEICRLIRSTTSTARPPNSRRRRSGSTSTANPAVLPSPQLPMADRPSSSHPAAVDVIDHGRVEKSIEVRRQEVLVAARAELVSRLDARAAAWLDGRKPAA